MAKIPDAGAAGDAKPTGGYAPAVDYEPADTEDAPPPPARYVPFPTHLLPDPAAALVRAGSASIGCEAAYVALPALAAMAAAIGNARHAVVKAGWTEPPIVWAMLVGPSGTAKTPAARVALAPVHARHATLIAANEAATKAHREDLKRYEAELANWKKKPSGDPPAEPEPPTLERAIIEDTTVEALAAILRANPRGVLLHRDELAGWIGGFDRYAQNGGGDVARWLSIFNAEAITVDRKTSGTTYVPRPCVCVVGGIQPDRLPAVLTRTLRDSGLLARILIASPPPQPKRFNAADLDAEAVDDWQAMLAGLTATLAMEPDDEGVPTRPVYVGMSRAAQAAFGAWADAFNVETVTKPGEVASARSKLEAYAVRFALIFALCDGDERIEVGHVRRGCALADWFAAEAERVHESAVGASDADREAEALARWVAGRGGRATLRDVTHGIRRYRSKVAEAEAVAQRLVDDGRARWDHGQRRPGHPSRTLVLLEGEAVPDVTVTETPAGDVGGGGNGDGDAGDGRAHAATDAA